MSEPRTEALRTVAMLEAAGFSDDEQVRFLDTIEAAGLTLLPKREAATPPLDAPPEAIEWARELVRQGYRDEHVVTFTEDGYGLEHPIRCRPNLTGCILNEWLRTQMAPDREPGRYIMEWTDNGPEYARLTAGQEERHG